MTTHSVDVLVIGGGIHGAAVARDAAGRGLKVMLAEKGDYASATSSASSKLIHGGLRYLEHFELRLVRESLIERAQLLSTAPYLVAPIRFLLPIYGWQRRQAIKLRAGLAIYDVLSFGDGLPASGRLDDDAIAQLPQLRQTDLTSVLQYYDCKTDDARPVARLAARPMGPPSLARNDAGLEKPVTVNRTVPSESWSRTKSSSPDSGCPGRVP